MEEIKVDSNGKEFVEKTRQKKRKGVHTFVRDPHYYILSRVISGTRRSFALLGDRNISMVVDKDSGDIYYFDGMTPPVSDDGTVDANKAFHKIVSGFPNCTIMVCKVVKGDEVKDKESSVLFQGANEHCIPKKWLDDTKHHQRMD